MRNRTELVTNTGSDYDENEEFEADDGSDDWKPDPEVNSNFTVRNIFFFFNKFACVLV